jgi:hypothetical protein
LKSASLNVLPKSFNFGKLMWQVAGWQTKTEPPCIQIQPKQLIRFAIRTWHVPHISYVSFAARAPLRSTLASLREFQPSWVCFL